VRLHAHHRNQWPRFGPNLAAINRILSDGVSYAGTKAAADKQARLRAKGPVTSFAAAPDSQQTDRRVGAQQAAEAGRQAAASALDRQANTQADGPPPQLKDPWGVPVDLHARPAPPTDAARVCLSAKRKAPPTDSACVGGARLAADPEFARAAAVLGMDPAFPHLLNGAWQGPFAERTAK
jgi:hypothetical protein